MSKRGPFGSFDPGDLRVLSLGIELAAAIGGLGWLGDWLDRRWQTNHWLLFSGILLGTVGGCWNIYKVAQKEGFFGKNKSRKRDADIPPGDGGNDNSHS